MLSATAYHPQVSVSLSHLNTLLNSLRSGGTFARIPKGGQSHRAFARSCASEIQEGPEKKSDTEALKETQVSQMDLDSCMAILLEETNLKKLLALFGIPEGSPWRTNYVSAPTFFENKNGFAEQMLEVRNPQVASLFHKPEVIKLLSQNLTPAIPFTQKRWSHHGRISGLGRASFQNKSPFFKIPDTIAKTKERETIDSILKGEDEQIKDKLKMAFTEGYMVKEDRSSLKSRIQAAFIWVLRLCMMMAIISMLFTFFTRGGVKSGGSPFQMLNQSFNEVNPEEVNVNFDDVKGCDEAKEELQDIVEFLKNRERFQSVGAKLPKGVLMVGSPGVGKTMLAKAVAGEAGVPFFMASGSEFDEVFVGTGAMRVRSLFASAKARAPSVIFMDEIDSVGAKRTNSQIHPYANQTVNQLLNEMDGFSGSSGVIVIGATNKRENLDNALLRPGRFDMEVTVLPPDANGRKEIFKLYLSKVNADSKLDLKKLGQLSRGMTGADINNLVNQAALRAALKNKKLVTMEDLEYARDKIMMGPQWKNKKLSKKNIENTAYHEAGHTLVAHYTKDALPLDKVTILPRGHALGVTSFVPNEDMDGQTKSELLAQIDVAMGGRAAEELQFGKDSVGMGAADDISKATRLATWMVKKLGMSDSVGPRVYDDPKLDGGSSFIQINDTSPEMQKVIDSEISRILDESYSRAINILKTHGKEHTLLAEALIKYETLSKKEIEAAIKGRPIVRTPSETPKTKEGVAVDNKTELIH